VGERERGLLCALGEETGGGVNRGACFWWD
jgi:hypothetical protein